MRKVYVIRESDIPQLYNVGLVGVAGIKYPVNAHTYYKKQSHPTPTSNYDEVNNEYYQVLNAVELDRFKQLNNQVQPIIKKAFDDGDITNIINLDTSIIDKIDNVKYGSALHDDKIQIENQNKITIRQNGAKLFGESITNTFNQLTEPFRKGVELTNQTVTDTGKLLGSPLTWILIAGVGIAFLKLK